MKLLETRTYQGPNLYAHFPVMRLTLQLGPLEARPSATLPGFCDRLLDLIPTLAEHTCSVGSAGGFVRRLTEGEGTWLGHVLEHVAIELQNLCGARVSFGKTRGSGESGEYHVVYEYEDARVGQAAGDLALRLLHHLVGPDLATDAPFDAAFDFPVERDKLIRDSQRRALGPSTLSLVRAAEARGIPWLRLNDYSLVQFGYGKWQKRIQATVTSETRHISVEIASDKQETNRILADLGLPVPKQEMVYSLEDALRAARRVGWPLVVKPLNANHGRGVSIGLRDDEGVRLAFDKAREHSRAVLVESFITGEDHRMLVIHGELVAVAKRVPGHVVGDGVHTVEELVHLTNQDPRRGIGHEKVLTRLEFDHQAERLLQQSGVTRTTVIEAGQVLYLRSTGNLSTGGTAIDLTDVVHPDNAEMAIRAAQAIGLDVIGIDFLTPDISKSYREVGGAVCEVNAAPGFRMHVAPSEGKPRDVAAKVIEMLFPPGTPARIPIAAITGTNGKTTTARMLAHIFKLRGETVGLTTTDGVYIDGRRTVEGDMTGPVSAQMVLRDPTVSVAVLETARGGLLRAGMGYKFPDVACCLNVAADHLGLGGIDTLDQLAGVKRIPIEVARDAVVLNADDPLCLQMADWSEAKHVWYVTVNPQHTLVREHIRAGGKAVALEGGVNGQMITLYDRGAHLPLLWTHLIPATIEGRALHNVQNAMFAAALAVAMGVKLDDVRHGLRTFDSTYFQSPGRMNIYDGLGFKVILDYGHNPAAVQAMCRLVDGLHQSGAVPGRKVCILAAPGDRRDEDIRHVAQIAAKTFDLVICRRDDNPRGRKPDEVPRMLESVLLEAGLAADQVRVIPYEVDALQAALEVCRPGDVLLAFCDKVSRSWKQIIYFHGTLAGREVRIGPDGEARLAEPDGAGPGAMAAGRAAVQGRQKAHGESAADVQRDESGEDAGGEGPFGLGLPEGVVRDERGVRLARTDEAD
ncbi:MAG: cyanophycin synthetase [Myxococcales bacterium]|nr:cyanophycin synthetase [Myxococcales bacterium]